MTLLYKLHRIASNAERWRKPSPGRLGQGGMGQYVRENGFGHEDWNFNFDLALNGKMLGYTVAIPSLREVGKKFGLILATYDPGGWRAVGFYDGVTFLAEPSGAHADAIAQMTDDVYELAKAGQAAPRFTNMTRDELKQEIANGFVYFRWQTQTENVCIFREPLPIPKALFNPGVQRMTISYDLDQRKFARIASLGGNAPSISVADDGVEEGERRLRVHLAAERDHRIIKRFKDNLSSFACEVCGFDFERTYGEIGRQFIECHHTKPVALMRPSDRTKLEDLSAVCSNCHRMLHASKPMLSLAELREKIRRTQR